MIFIILSVYACDYQYLIIDAKNFGLSGVATAIPNSPFDNPASSSLIRTFVGIDAAYIFSGFSNAFTIKGSLKSDNYGLGFLFFNNTILGIPDTRDALIDLDDDGELDEGEYIDTSKIVYKDAFQNIFIFNISKRLGLFYYGGNIKIFYENLMGERGIGGGFDLGFIFSKNDLNFGIKLRDFLSSQILWKETRQKLNPAIVLGSSFIIKKSNFLIKPCFDIIIDDYGASALFGFAVSYNERVEILTGSKRNALTFGSGFYFKDIRFHYSFMLDYKENFPLTHRITISKCFYQ